MRFNTDEQLQKVMLRKVLYQRCRDRHISDGLTAAALCLAVGLAAVLSFFSDSKVSDVADSAYGAFLLGSSSGGYVFCGVIAFVCGCVVTLLCIRAKQRQDEKKTGEIERSHSL